MDTGAIVAAFLSIAFLGSIVNGVLLWILAKIVGGESTFIKSIAISLLIFIVKVLFAYGLGISQWWAVPVSWVIFVFGFHIVIWRAMILSVFYWLLDFFFAAGLSLIMAMVGS